MYEYLNFKLTKAEKAYIKAYYKLRSAISYKPSIGDILEAFKWDDEFRERYIPAYRDFLYDDQQYVGAFDVVRSAIEKELKALDDKNFGMFYS